MEKEGASASSPCQQTGGAPCAPIWSRPVSRRPGHQWCQRHGICCRLKPSVAVSEPECGRLWGKPLKAHHRLFYSVLKENGFRSTSLRVFLLIRPPKPHEKAKRSVAKPGFRNGHTQSKSTRTKRETSMMEPTPFPHTNDPSEAAAVLA